MTHDPRAYRAAPDEAAYGEKLAESLSGVDRSRFAVAAALVRSGFAREEFVRFADGSALAAGAGETLRDVIRRAAGSGRPVLYCARAAAVAAGRTGEEGDALDMLLREECKTRFGKSPEEINNAPGATAESVAALLEELSSP